MSGLFLNLGQYYIFGSIKSVSGTFALKFTITTSINIYKHIELFRWRLCAISIFLLICIGLTSGFWNIESLTN